MAPRFHVVRAAAAGRYQKRYRAEENFYAREERERERREWDFFKLYREIRAKPSAILWGLNTEHPEDAAQVTPTPSAVEWNQTDSGRQDLGASEPPESTADSAPSSHVGQCTPSLPDIDQTLNEAINSEMTCDEIVSILENHGCANLTSALDEATCSQHPIVNGGSGDVFYGRLLNGTQVAIKIIRSSHDPSEKVRVFHKRVAKEIHTWSKCRHRNVAELMGSAVFRDCLAMVSRWENNGNMPHYLSRHPNADRCKMSVSICAGLVYLHSKNIIHGDLKGANVLISRNGTPMLTDFGNASLLDATLLFTATRTGLGFSLRWAPPEILEEANPHTTASDVYSLGMTILEAHTSEIPFSNRPDQSLLVYIVIRKMLPDRPEKAIPTRSQYGDHLWATLRKCWSYNPKNRPSAETVLERITPITAKTLKEFKDRSDRRKN